MILYDLLEYLLSYNKYKNLFPQLCKSIQLGYL